MSTGNSNSNRSINLQYWVKNLSYLYGFGDAEEFVSLCFDRKVSDLWTIRGWLGLQRRSKIATSNSFKNISKQKSLLIGRILDQYTDGDFDEYTLDLRHDVFETYANSKRNDFLKRAKISETFIGTYLLYMPSLNFPSTYCREILIVESNRNFTNYFVSAGKDKKGYSIERYCGTASERPTYLILPAIAVDGRHQERVIYVGKQHADSNFDSLQFGILASTARHHDDNIAACRCILVRVSQDTNPPQNIENNVTYFDKKSSQIGEISNAMLKYLDTGIYSSELSINDAVIHISADSLARKFSGILEDKLAAKIRKRNPVEICERLQ